MSATSSPIKPAYYAIAETYPWIPSLKVSLYDNESLFASSLGRSLKSLELEAGWPEAVLTGEFDITFLKLAQLVALQLQCFLSGEG